MQDAYECLIDDQCYDNYVQQLLQKEIELKRERSLLVERALEQSVNALTHAHYLLSLAANHIYSLGQDIWVMAGEVEIEVFGVQHKLGQYLLMSVLLFSPAQIFLKMHVISYIFQKVSTEFARSKVMF